MGIGRERAGGQELEFRLWFGVESEVGVGSERGIGKRKSGPAIGWGSSRASSSEKRRVGRELWERMGGVWSIFNDAFGLSIEASRMFQAEIPGRDASPAASAGFRAGFANLDGFSTDTRIPTGISAEILDPTVKQNSRVPQFGKWENDGSVPYTQYFENARKGKNATKLINPNDPLQNPEAFHQDDPPFHTYPSRAPSSQVSARVKHERHKSREDVDVNRAVKYLSTENLATHKHVSGSPNKRHDQGNLGHPQRKPNHSNGELEHSIERSPIHPHLSYRSSSKGAVSSPSRERRSSSDKHGLAPNTPGRTKMKPNDQSDYSIDKGSAVPKFGEWDVSDPSSADSYSYIFNQVREEKHSGSTKISSISRESNSNGQKKKINSESTDVCCFCFKK